MIQNNLNNLIIILGVVAILVELAIGVATGFDLLIIGTTLIIGGIVGNLFNSPQIALTTSSILLVLYLFTVRKLIKNSLNIKTHKTSVDNLIGKSALVIKDIEIHKPGQIKVEGEIWRAEGATQILKGATVIIQSVSGVTLKVTPEK